MKLRTLAITIVLTASAALAEVAPNLVVQGVPEIPREIAAGVAPYLEFRTASHSDWHPTRREILISTRFGDTAQLHYVRMPGGARKQLTFFPDRVGGGSFSPANENVIVFSKDIGGAEFFQIYRFDRGTGAVALLTDGKSRNSGGRWSNDGKRIAYSSTKRNGQDTDIYIMNVMEPGTDRLLLELKGGGWQTQDWSADNQKLVVSERISINESYLYLVDVQNGTMRLLTSKGGAKISFSQASFSPDGQSIYLISDEGSEFTQLVRMNLGSGAKKVLIASARADVDEFELSEDGKTIAYTTNELGIGILHLFDVNSGKELTAPKLPLGTVYGLDWHRNSRDLAFNLVSAKSTQDVFSLDLNTGKVERWTESETGGLDPSRNVEPELVTMKSFDGTTISGFIYRPDPAKFPGKRPVLISIHGGPEGQFQPGFLGRSNYLINELGIAILYPNVRGSSGYGKTFLTLDNGMKREDSVRDIGAFIQWIKSDRSLEGDRIGVTGGSYGGYMTLAVMTHYSDQLRAAVDVVGISNFVSFLRNTQGYRRDLRRVEYGDERDESMRAFLEKISPLTNAAKIKKPLFVVQGFNDPRVPYTEAEQIVKAVRDNSVPVWYLMAKDEGHGFAKKANADYQFMSTILFWQEHLLGK